jgi:hypothetical protein
MTIWAAKAAYEENVKGSIETGKYADFVIMEEDILNVELEIIPNLKVHSCFIGGDNVLNIN